MVTTTMATKRAEWEATVRGKALSPMVPLKNNLRFLKYVGLPLEFSNDATEMNGKGRLWKCILLPGGKSSARSGQREFCTTATDYGSRLWERFHEESFQS